MGSKGLLQFKAIVKMLEECAEGWSWKLKTHNRQIYYSGKTAHLPKYDEIAIGHVRHMIRFLGIDPDCAKEHLPSLR